MDAAHAGLRCPKQRLRDSRVRSRASSCQDQGRPPAPEPKGTLCGDATASADYERDVLGRDGRTPIASWSDGCELRGFQKSVRTDTELSIAFEAPPQQGSEKATIGVRIDAPHDAHRAEGA